MKKNISKCDIKKVASLAVVRYQNVSDQTKGCLFWGENYVCDTIEDTAPHDSDMMSWNECMPIGNYHLEKRRLKKVSLGGGFYRPGETRLYIKNQTGVTFGMFTDDCLHARDGNIGVGYRNGNFDEIRPQMLVNSERAHYLLTKELSKLDYVFLHVCDATREQIALLRACTLWNKGASFLTLSDYVREELTDPFHNMCELPTLETLITKSQFINA